MPKIPGETDLPGDWVLEVTYKPIRNIWFRVDSRRRRFRISAPEGIHPESLKRAIRAKADWMVSRATRPAPPLLIPERVSDGDTCLVNGNPSAVTVHSNSAKNLIFYDPESGVDIHAKKGGDAARILSDWYRQRLSRDIPDLIGVWEPRLGVRVSQFRIRKMKTRWGSCNIRAKRIWINLSLACLPRDLLAYVVVHEMLHLLEPSHNSRFYRLMENAIPDWRRLKSELSSYAPGL